MFIENRLAGSKGQVWSPRARKGFQWNVEATLKGRCNYTKKREGRRLGCELEGAMERSTS